MTGASIPTSISIARFGGRKWRPLYSDRGAYYEDMDDESSAGIQETDSPIAMMIDDGTATVMGRGGLFFVPTYLHLKYEL